ncbi:hypothetical protein NWI01_29330 [Nitrobacter winogradskyi]|uniref:Uncharacterized protein n=1 Tax=Nitrobacter winogradskyi TaxID=913 RepID=A0A4Y3WFV0_NITWI|nr:hypothetical protein NWI01_29330 [Nitrobacter winogradskyi]
MRLVSVAQCQKRSPADSEAAAINTLEAADLNPFGRLTIRRGSAGASVNMPSLTDTISLDMV